MKTTLKTLFIAAVLSTLPLQAMAETKIGVVDMRSLMANSPQAKAAVEKMKKDFKPREEKIVAMDKALKEKAEKLKRDSAVMSEAEKAKAEKELIASKRELERLQGEFREDAMTRQQEEMKKIYENISKAVEDMAKKEKYDLILPMEIAPYVSSQLNITDKISKAVNGT